MRTRNTIEFLGLWEQLKNPNFKSIEFDAFRNESGSNSFTLTPKKWIEATNSIGIISKAGSDANPTLANKSMNIRDIASINELAILSNLETLNAQMIKENIDKRTRFRKLKE